MPEVLEWLSRVFPLTDAVEDVRGVDFRYGRTACVR